MQELFLADELIPLVRRGVKTGTARLGYRDIHNGPMRLVSTNGTEPEMVVQVTDVVYSTLGRLADCYWKREGVSKERCLELLRSFYPDIEEDSHVTFIGWE